MTWNKITLLNNPTAAVLHIFNEMARGAVISDECALGIPGDCVPNEGEGLCGTTVVGK